MVDGRDRLVLVERRQNRNFPPTLNLRSLQRGDKEDPVENAMISQTKTSLLPVSSRLSCPSSPSLFVYFLRF